MKKISVFISLMAIPLAMNAAWYWPFGSDDEKKPPRVSELMEPVSIAIDEASDYAEDGKIPEAIESYHRALRELDRIEAENQDRVQSSAFATVRNKRAYVNAAIDSLHLKQAKLNARSVAVTDTTELEKKLAIKQGKVVATNEVKVAKKSVATKSVAKSEEVKKSVAKSEEPKKSVATSNLRAEAKKDLMKDPKNRRAQVKLAMADIKAKDYDAAQLTIDAMLEERPNDTAALILRASMLADQGNLRGAERVLDQAIQSNPRSHFAYYNMARLLLRSRGNDGKASARRYYEAGRSFGGPVDSALEAKLK